QLESEQTHHTVELAQALGVCWMLDQPAPEWLIHTLYKYLEDHVSPAELRTLREFNDHLALWKAVTEERQKLTPRGKPTQLEECHATVAQLHSVSEETVKRSYYLIENAGGNDATPAKVAKNRS